MKILSVTQSYYPFLEKGGPATKVRAITRALVRRGNQVTVLTADLGFGPREIAAAKVVRDPEGWRTDLDGVEVIYFRTRCHYRNLTVNPGVVRFCRRRLKEFDIVHMYGLYDTLGPAVGRYCRKLRSTVFCGAARNDAAHRQGIPAQEASGGNWQRIIWARQANGSQLRNWNGTIYEMQGFLPGRCCSDLTASIGKSSGTFLPSVPFGKVQEIPDDERLILFLGRLIPRKGADLLIEALPQIGGDKIKLVIAGPEGETGYLAFLRDKARILGISQRVLFPGPLYERFTEEPSWMRRCLPCRRDMRTLATRQRRLSLAGLPWWFPIAVA